MHACLIVLQTTFGNVINEDCIITAEGIVIDSCIPVPSEQYVGRRPPELKRRSVGTLCFIKRNPSNVSNRTEIQNQIHFCYPHIAPGES